MMSFFRRSKQPAPTSPGKAREPAGEGRGGIRPVAGLALMESGESPNHPLKIGRSLARPTVTLSLDKDLMRVVAFQSTKVVAWGKANLEEEPAPTEEGVSTHYEGQAARLRPLDRKFRPFCGGPGPHWLRWTPSVGQHWGNVK